MEHGNIEVKELLTVGPEGIAVPNSVPQDTAYKIYRNGSTLYWNGSQVGSSYTLPVAAAGSLGGIRVGSGLSIDGDGILSSMVPSNMVTTDSAQTITGDKTFNSAVLVTPADANGSSVDLASSGFLAKMTQGRSAGDMTYIHCALNNHQSVGASITVYNKTGATYTGYGFTWSHVTQDGWYNLGTAAVAGQPSRKISAYVNFDFKGGVWLSDATPYSTANALYSIGGVLHWNGSAIGGAAPANMATIDTTQTIDGLKTFTSLVSASAIDVAILAITGTSNLQLQWKETMGAADTKNWDFYTNGGVFYFRTPNDAYSAANYVYTVSRNGNMPGTFSLYPLLQVQKGIKVDSYTPGTTSNTLYNVSGVLHWNGAPVATITSEFVAMRVTDSQANGNVSALRARPMSGITDSNNLIALYTGWNGSTYSGPALYFGRGNGNGWFTTTTKGMFFFSGIANTGTAENMYFSAFSSVTASVSNSSLVLEADTKKVLLGGLTASASARKVQTTGGIYVASEGIEIASGTPASTAASLYNVSGALHWNGAPLQSKLTTTSEAPAANLSMTSAWVNRHTRVAPTAVLNVVVEPDIANVSDEIQMLQENTNFFVLTAGAGVTLRCATSQTTIQPRARYSCLRLICIAANTYDVIGDFVP